MDKSLLIIGYGNQAKAWGLNLKDSGWKITYGLRDQSTSLKLINTDLFAAINIDKDPIASFQNIALLIPDHTHQTVLKNIKNKISAHSRIIYAHGFSLTNFNLQKSYPSLKHLLLAPKAIASELRFQYECGGGIGGFYSLEFIDKVSVPTEKQWLETLAADLGINVGPYSSSFQEESDADLFSEQSLLCSILPYASLACYNKLREKGISKELAYFESWYEVKLIAQAMVDLGPVEFFKLISPNALYGSEKGFDALVQSELFSKMDGLLDDILTKKFYKEVKDIDINALRENIISKWQNEELTKTHNKISPGLRRK